VRCCIEDKLVFCIYIHQLRSNLQALIMLIVKIKIKTFH
jgi:hypothetical protein